MMIVLLYRCIGIKLILTREHTTILPHVHRGCLPVTSLSVSFVNDDFPPLDLNIVRLVGVSIGNETKQRFDERRLSMIRHSRETKSSEFIRRQTSIAMSRNQSRSREKHIDEQVAKQRRERESACLYIKTCTRDFTH